MADQKSDAANAQFKKLQRAADGRKAMSEYETEVAAIAAKTARLRALRLAKEAEEAANPPPPVVKKSAAKKSVKSKTTKAAKAPPLSDWLDAQKGSGRTG
jgi:hypothetical protein